MEDRGLAKPEHLRDVPTSRKKWLLQRPFSLVSCALGLISFVVVATTLATHEIVTLGPDRTLVRQSLVQGESDDQRVAGFVALMRAEARGWLSEREAVALETAAPFEQIWAGLARYWRKQAQPPAS